MRIMACGRRAVARSLFDSVRARENEAVLKQVYTNSERANAVAGAVSFLSMPMPRAVFSGRSQAYSGAATGRDGLSGALIQDFSLRGLMAQRVC